jgi:hypothetical protein
MSNSSSHTVRNREVRPTQQEWGRRAVRARTVGEFVPTLMRSAFEKYGFPAASLLTDWSAIAGPELARYTAPERLKWPRAKSGTDEGTGGATLILRVAGAHALEVEQMRPQLIARINASFGYRAVADIRVIQAPLVTRHEAKRSVPFVDPQVSPELECITEPRLQAAFARMASAIAGKSQK